MESKCISHLPLGITKLLVMFLMVNLSLCASSEPFYTAAPFFKSGTWTPVTQLKSSSDNIPDFNVNFNTALTNQADLDAVTSMSSFDCLASNQFSFNTTISDLTLSGFTATLRIIGNTYINLIRFNYLAMTWDSTSFANDIQFLYADCFLAMQLIVNTGSKSQIIKAQNFNTPVSDGTSFYLQSFITGLSFLNNKNTYKKVSVKSYISNDTDYITHQIQVNHETTLQWICLGTVVVQSLDDPIFDEITPCEIGYFNLNRVTSDIDMPTFPSDYATKFGLDDTKFFGLSQIEMYLGKTYQIIDIKTQNVLNLQLGYQSLAAGGKMGYFFFVQRQCTTQPQYSVVDNKCWDACPAGQILQGTACHACHFSCQTCDGPLQTDCQSCNSSKNRGSLTPEQTCLCKDGYLQNGLTVCPPCSDFIPNCKNCTSQAECIECSGLFIFNDTSIKCQCPINTYLIVKNQVCASYPGCLDAQIQPNAILCKVCDTAKNLYLDTNIFTCNCSQSYVQDAGQCVDICGDGVNTYTNSTTYCDDGARVSGDGCSSTCQIQIGYGCFNLPLSRSFCSPQKTFTLKYLYAQRVINENAGTFSFEVSPADSQLSAQDFIFYVETSIYHSSVICSYDQKTSILKIKVIYLQQIQDQSHSFRITLDPYKMSVIQKTFHFQASGVNYNLTFDEHPQLTIYLFYSAAIISGLIVIASLVFIFLSYKIAAVQLLLSSQVVYLGVLSCNSDNLALYPLTGLKYLVGFNTLKQFQINSYNFNTPSLIKSHTFAQFLLNLNVMAAVLILIIIIIIPLKINVWYRKYKRSNFTSTQMQQKLMKNNSNLSLKQLSTNIKTAQFIADTYIDRAYFGFSIILFLPIVVYFSIQLGFIGKVGSYELSSFANIISSILFFMVDFCFFIIIFQDTDKKVKIFNFGSKKLKKFPFRLTMFYFGLVCMFTVVLITQFTFYVLIAMNLLVAFYIIYRNPFKIISLEYIDSISKPIISLLCLVAMKMLSYFTNKSIFIPIIIVGLLLISLTVSTIRTVRVKVNRAQTVRRLTKESRKLDEKNQFDGDLKNQNKSQLNSERSRKSDSDLNRPFDQGKQQGKTYSQVDGDQSQKSRGFDHQNDQSGVQMIKNNLAQNQLQFDEVAEEDQDQLTRIKRALRRDLKKRRGIVNKVNQEGLGFKQKGTKSKKSKQSLSPLNIKYHNI